MSMKRRKILMGYQSSRDSRGSGKRLASGKTSAKAGSVVRNGSERQDILDIMNGRHQFQSF